jgi:cobalt-zinc-cadmium efflux system protein
MGHDHHHHGPPTGNKRRLRITLAMSATYMVAEIVGGYLSDSLALLADAGHMLADVASIALSLVALWIAERPATSNRTFGFYRAEILAALANGALLWAISIYIVFEAIGRLGEPHEVRGGLMLVIAAGGLVTNIVSLFVIGGGHDNLNMRGAWLHVLADALGSVGAILAGVLIWTFGWELADPIISILIAGLVVWSGWGLLRESVLILMESAPLGIDPDRVQDTMMSVPGVTHVHDLHVWTISSGIFAMAAHVVVPDQTSHRAVLKQLRDALHDNYGIDHITVQIEPEGFKD